MDEELSQIDLEMKTELQKIKDKYNSQKKQIRLKYKHMNKKETPKKPRTARKTIPKILKNQVWDKHIGREKGIGNCKVCQCEIDSKGFECGHIISVKENGPTTIDNLVPICSTCNKSMGTDNLESFKEKYFTSNKLARAKIINKFICEKLEKDEPLTTTRVGRGFNSIWNTKPFVKTKDIYMELKEWGLREYNFLEKQDEVMPLLIELVSNKYGKEEEKEEQDFNEHLMIGGFYNNQHHNEFGICGNNLRRQNFNVKKEKGFYNIKMI